MGPFTEGGSSDEEERGEGRDEKSVAGLLGQVTGKPVSQGASWAGNQV